MKLSPPYPSCIVLGRSIIVLLLLTCCCVAQDEPDSSEVEIETPTADEVTSELANGGAKKPSGAGVASEVKVDPVNSDDEIASRLQEVFEATGWFQGVEVEVDRGVAFLRGEADTQTHQAWAEATAMNTTDVVAVVNRIGLADRPLWNFAPAIASLKQLGREATSMLPLFVVAIAIAVLGYYLARAAAWLTQIIAGRRIETGLLKQVIGNVVGVLVFIVVLYIALRVSGMTRLAVTLLGGTGLIGLALGFAFRDIAENYLASILISLNHPFNVGDLIEVDGSMGYVRKVTTRGTVLNTIEGNQIQLPNSTVYKGKILNYTATPLLRLHFTVGIGFEDSITEAQALVMDVLGKHEAVLSEPAPMVLVESLGSATVNLRCYYWFDQTVHSGLKLGSSVIRQVKQVLTEAGITMPDEARELVFPNGVPVQMVEPPRPVSTLSSTNQSAAAENTPEQEVSVGEGDLLSEQGDVIEATKTEPNVDQEVNLIE